MVPAAVDAAVAEVGLVPLGRVRASDPGPVTGPARQRAGQERPVHCAGCAASFGVKGWPSLPLVAVLTGDAIASHVVKWPAGVAIEIRRCPRCSRSIARTCDPQAISRT